MKKIAYVCFIFVCCSFIACEDQDEILDLSDSSAYFSTMNDFIYEKMNDVYLWADEISGKTVLQNQNPYNYIKQIRYGEDGWSYVDSLYSAEVSQMSDTRGFTNGYGYSLQYYYAYGYSYYMAIVNYVYPNSPADNVGLKRGDVILKKNGEKLNDQNYMSLLTDKTLRLSYISQEDFSWGKSLDSYKYKIATMTYSRTDIDPILVDTIYERCGKKIAYMHYTEFVDNQTNSLAELSAWASRVKHASVDEVIIDLRYNGGGYVSAARHLASLLAPQSVVAAEKVMVKQEWNKKYQALKSAESRMVRFKSDVVADNLNLSHITFIVSARTASASELLISALMPYMDKVTLVGIRTHGKYVASQGYKPTVKALQYWAFFPVVFSYKNAEDLSVKGGLIPNVELSENEKYFYPLGDTREWMLAAVLGDIPSVTAAIKSTPKAIPIYIEYGMLINNE